jgi:phosphoribosylformylglycinamidine cyclo-ligase
LHPGQLKCYYFHHQEGKPIKETYAASGVDIEAAARAKELIARQARSTQRPEVLSGVGFFGGLFEFKGYREPVLVSSVDGVGTKLKLASALGKHDTVGIDIVNHCVNDILTCGAEPLFFLDYIAAGKLKPEQVAEIAKGLAQACREAGCALIGGETAEMPGLYSGGDYDLVGFIVGVVEKSGIIMIFGETKVALNTSYPELGRTLGEALLEPHRSYYRPLKPLLPLVRGLAHITGGGLIGNVPRVLPEGLTAKFDSQSWSIPPIFELIQKRGNVDRDEMYKVFNMGIGMAVVCAKGDVDRLTKALPEARVIGEVMKQQGKARVVIN